MSKSIRSAACARQNNLISTKEVFSSDRECYFRKVPLPSGQQMPRTDTQGPWCAFRSRAEGALLCVPQALGLTQRNTLQINRGTSHFSNYHEMAKYVLVAGSGKSSLRQRHRTEVSPVDGNPRYRRGPTRSWHSLSQNLIIKSDRFKRPANQSTGSIAICIKDGFFFSGLVKVCNVTYSSGMDYVTPSATKDFGLGERRDRPK
jgi:hypothetical protein